MGLTQSVKKDIKHLESIDGRAGADTIRLWESYRSQAHMWRALCLVQLPATLMASFLALIMFFFADQFITVPEKPLPGRYDVKVLADEQYINFATNVVNLIATYQPVNARRQFDLARKYLWEPALSNFEQTSMKTELRNIEETKRTQVFFFDDRLIRVERQADDKVLVRLPGVRQKLIGDKALDPDEQVYWVTMTTIPRNIHNDFGIVAIDINIETTQRRAIADGDRRENRKRALEESNARRMRR